MTTVRNLLAGLGGAIALNILHESLKNKGKDMPRIDKLGEEAVQKGIEKAGGEKIKSEENLYVTTLGADLMSNALYYSAIGVGNRKYMWAKAIALGLSGGTGAVALAEPLGLNPETVAKNDTTKSLTVGYYLFGAIVTACILKVMDSRNILA